MSKPLPCKCSAVVPVPDDVRLLNSRQAAAALGVGTRTLSRFVALGRIRPVRFSPRCVRFRLSDVRALIDAAQKAGTP